MLLLKVLNHTNTTVVYETDISKLKSSIDKSKEILGGPDASGIKALNKKLKKQKS